MSVANRSLRVLFVHNGTAFAAHVAHLTAAGLRVTETHGDSALEAALKLQPDIVVVDFGYDGGGTAQIKGHSLTRAIPIIAIAALTGGTV